MDGPLDGGLVEVMTETLAGGGVDADPRRRGDPLPRPLGGCGGVLPREAAREGRAREAVREVGLVESVDLDEVPAERGAGDARKRCSPGAAAPGVPRPQRATIGG